MIRLSVAPLFLLLATLSGCSGSGDSDSSPTISTWTTNWGADQSTSFAFLGDHFAYLASEAHSAAFDANGDGDTLDSFPVVVDSVSKVETQLAVAARGLVWVGDHLYLDVLEIDGVDDWDGGGLGERVLLHWTAGMTNPVYVVTLDLGAEIALVSTGELAIAATTATTTMASTPLVLLEAGDPTNPIPVPNADLAVGTSVEILGLESGLLFVGIDETSSATDHNGDLDATDERVLGLLDATHEIALGTYADSLRSIGLALPAGDTPLLAVADGSHDWLVAFLVDEASQDSGSGMGLNTIGQVGQTFSPCYPSNQDSDILDEVLHFLKFSDFVSGLFVPTNSGLVGGERIIHADGYVGTVSREGEEGDCDLNGDGDLNDRIFRWILANQSNLTHENDDSRLHALSSISGPAGELAEMGDRFVIVVNEAKDGRDHEEGNGIQNRDLIAWLEPAAENDWTFHQDNDIEYGWVVPTWMGEAVGTSRVGVGFSEQSNDVPFDLNEDGDTVDSVPTFAYYDSGTGFMEFPGYAIGGDSDNMGIVILGSWAYYRVSEAENGGDLNGNGSGTDMLLWASHLSTGQTLNISALNSVNDTPAVLSDPSNASCAAFLVKEGGAVGDVNGDGDTSGYAVKYLRF
jgi:hypothetical protein